MIKNTLSNLLIAFYLSLAFTPSCVSMHAKPWLNPNLLNGDRIKEKFGSYGVDILKQDDAKGIRLSSLYSEHEGQKITRTLALTKFTQILDERLKNAHEEILRGGSIGATLKKHGFSLQKNGICKGLSDFPVKVGEMMNSMETTFATYIYDLIVTIDGEKVFYCSITEIYAPDYLTLEEVGKIYPDVNCFIDQDNEQLMLVKELVAQI